MNNNSKIILIALFVFTCLKCDDIIVADISDRKVNLLAPRDSTLIIGDSVDFWWDYLEDAEYYNFRIATPSLTDAIRIVADTTTTRNSLTFKIPPGEYEWEVNAFNSGYQTDFFYRSFSIDSIPQAEVDGLEIELIVPSEQAFVLGKSVTLNWSLNRQIEAYRLTIVSPDFQNATGLVLDTLISNNKHIINLFPGSYGWRVQGFNGESGTKVAQRSFSIDSILRVDLSNIEPTIISPVENEQIIGLSVNMRWESMNGADAYNLRLVSPNFEITEKIILDTLVNRNSLTWPLNPGNYAFRVTAENTLNTSKSSTINFEIDSIVQVDISDVIPNVYTPQNNAHIIGSELKLQWETIDDVSFYNLTVVRSSFENIQEVLLDTSLSASSYTLPLDPGNYAVRLQGENLISKTQDVIHSFTIDSIQTMDISSTVVRLNAPGEGTIPSGEISFWWDEVGGATSYDLRIVSPGFDNINQLIYRENVFSNEIQISLDSGSYEWGVVAKNRDFETARSTRKLLVD